MIIGYSDGERKTAPRLPGIWVRQGRQVTLDRLDDVAEIISIAPRSHRIFRTSRRRFITPACSSEPVARWIKLE